MRILRPCTTADACCLNTGSSTFLRRQNGISRYRLSCAFSQVFPTPMLLCLCLYFGFIADLTVLCACGYLAAMAAWPSAESTFALCLFLCPSSFKASASTNRSFRRACSCSSGSPSTQASTRSLSNCYWASLPSQLSSPIPHTGDHSHMHLRQAALLAQLCTALRL